MGGKEMRVMFAVLAGMWALVAASSVPAEPWALAVDANLMLTQNAYSDSWVGGEAGSISWAFNSNSLAERQLSDRFHSKSTLKLSFGQTHSQDSETKHWAKPQKATDLIELESVLRLTLGAFADPFLGGRVETQFLDASDPTKDRYLNPVTLTETFGVARVLIGEEGREWVARLGAGSRQYIDRDVLVDTLAERRETQTAYDGGLEFVSDFRTSFADEQMTFASKLTVFKALFYSESDELEGLPNEDYWKSPDVDWENILTANINTYVMVNFYMQLLYDKEIDLRSRFKQTLSLGLTYKLI
ncbi:hypothetical protein AMJ82_06325 [candidate division TA06 bacterium SM23_40]|uniref:DUF3078 domain-containing protein n=2 Tax=Bacteria division TA06 TaxID=1156500 RepID=A0A0S8G8A6_UNCT6|nr:MAG: hypothetical protein AMJ82_06325 [candidate division TA06 bacterium SM23_40]